MDPEPCKMFRVYLSQSAPKESSVSEVVMYTTAVCAYCVAAKNFLKSRGVAYSEMRVDKVPDAMALMMEKTGRSSVPQIVINGVHVGGFDELVALDRSGGLQPMLETAP